MRRVGEAKFVADRLLGEKGEGEKKANCEFHGVEMMEVYQDGPQQKFLI